MSETAVSFMCLTYLHFQVRRRFSTVSSHCEACHGTVYTATERPSHFRNCGQS